ncbi:MAG: hypothetical protein KDE46_18405 [Caldilineaceae bacterium]|nr:hypothetical protein [Caldilineaceae bacterium]
MKEIIFLVKNSPQSGYEAHAVTASIFTEADTLDELWLMVKDAVDCHFEEHKRPHIIQLQPIS